MGQLTPRHYARLYISILLIFFAGASGPLVAQEMTAGDSHVYGPVSETDTLKSIAIQTINKRDFKLRDTMADIYYANPDAFVAGRSQILRSGVLLKLPEYLAWNVTSSSITNEEKSSPAESKPAEKPATRKQAMDKAPPESASGDQEAPPTTDQSKAEATSNSTHQGTSSRSKSDTAEDTQAQLQLLKRQLADMNAKLLESQEKSEINARLQGAFYLITAVIILILLTLIITRSRSQDKTPPQSTLKQEAGIASSTILAEDAPTTSNAAVESPATEPSIPVEKSTTPSSKGEAVDDDPTPVNPLSSIDEPTPLAPSMAYDDATPVNPSLAYQDEAAADANEEIEDNSGSDIHEVIHDISGRFKGMSDDKDASNLALARVYMDLGDYQQAKPLLTAVHKSVTPEYAKQAEDMIHELLQSQMFASSFNEIIGDLSDDDDSTVTRQLENLAAGNDPIADVSDSFLAHEDDEASHELEMAQIFFELGDHNRCKQHLAIILGSDSPSFKTEAYALLKEIELKEADDDDMTTKSDSLPDDIDDQPTIREITPPEKTYNKEQLDELSSQFMMISNNKNGTNLALAHVHFEMGEYETALKLLKEIVTTGDEECTPDAKVLIQKIGDINQA